MRLSTTRWGASISSPCLYRSALCGKPVSHLPVCTNLCFAVSQYLISLSVPVCTLCSWGAFFWIISYGPCNKLVSTSCCICLCMAAPKVHQNLLTSCMSHIAMLHMLMVKMVLV